MDHSELELLADHMGHSVNIHTSVYKLQSSLLERSRVAKLLCAVESGAVSKFREQKTCDEALHGVPEAAYTDSNGNLIP